MKKLIGRASAEGGLTDSDFNKTSSYNENFKSAETRRNPHLGEVKIITENSTKRKVIAKEKKFNDKKEATKAIISTRAKIANQNPYILKILDYSTTKQSELCSTMYILRQFYELYDADLKGLLNVRKMNKNGFSPQEIGNILYRIVKADHLGIHGDICPSNIVYDKSDNILKLLDKSDELPTALRALNIQKEKITSNQSLYQSPSTYSNLKRNNLKFNFDTDKEDAFALGLILLEVGNLTPINDIYDAGKKEINSTLLSNHINEFQKKYGAESDLSKIVKNMTKFNEVERIGMKGLGNSREFNNIINSSGSSTGHNIVVNSTTPIITTTTNTIGGIEERVTRIDTTITTTPIVEETVPSIYNGVNIHANAFYEKPVISAQTQNYKNVEYKYTPPVTSNPGPISHITVSRSDLTSVPPEIKNGNTVITETRKTFLSPAIAQEHKTYVTNYSSSKNNDISGTYSTVPPVYTQYSTYNGYVPSAPNRIVLEPEIRREVITANPVSQAHYYTSTINPAATDATTTVYTHPPTQVFYQNPQVITSFAPSNVPPATLRRSYSNQPVSIAQPQRISTYQTSPMTYVSNVPISYDTNVMNTQNPNIAPAISEVKNIPTTYTNQPHGSYTNVITYPAGSYTNVTTNYPTNYESYAPTTYTTYEPVTTMNQQNTYPLIAQENYYQSVINAQPIKTTQIAQTPTYIPYSPFPTSQLPTDYVASSTVIPQTTYNMEHNNYTTLPNSVNNQTYLTTNYVPSNMTTQYVVPVQTNIVPSGSAKQIIIPPYTNIANPITDYVPASTTTDYFAPQNNNSADTRAYKNYY